MDLMSLTAVELGRKIKAGEVAVKDAVLAAYEQIEDKDSELNCYVTTVKEGALKKGHYVYNRHSYYMQF